MTERAQPVTLINVFEVAPDKDEEFIRSWEQARDYLRAQPGFVSTTLHQSLAPNADFRFVNVAVWESAETFQAAIRSPGFQSAGQMPFRAHPALYRPIRGAE